MTRRKLKRLRRLWNRSRRAKPLSRDWWPRWDHGENLLTYEAPMDEAVHQAADTERNVKLTRG